MFHSRANYVGILIILLLSRFVTPTFGADEDSGRSTREVISRYCGIHCIYQILLINKKHVKFEDLITMKYVGNRMGSSLAELCRAAEDHGLHALPFSHGSAMLLRTLNDPAVLHVKSEHGLKAFNHWLLFLGVQDGKAWVCDGTKPATGIRFDELNELWDGNGFVVSANAIPKWKVYLPSLFLYALYVQIGIVVFWGSLFLNRAWQPAASLFASPGALRWFVTLRQAVLLLLLSSLVALGYRCITPDGFLSSIRAIKGIQETFIFTNFVTIGVSEFARHEAAQDVIFVDARPEEEYAAGHLSRAINIPPTSDLARCGAALQNVPKSAQIIVYCENVSCPFCKMVGQMLIDLGYRRLSLYEGGWQRWLEHVKQSGRRA